MHEESVSLSVEKNYNSFPRLQESQILQNSSEVLAHFAFLTRILQVCTRISNFAILLLCRTFLTRFC